MDTITSPNKIKFVQKNDDTVFDNSVILSKTKYRTFFLNGGVIYCTGDIHPDFQIYKHKEVLFLMLYTAEELGKEMFFLYDTKGIHPDIVEEMIQNELDDLTLAVGRFTIKIYPKIGIFDA